MTLTSYDNATAGSGSIVHQVQLAYNDFLQLITDYQSHSGAVNTSTTPHVQLSYADGSANTIRPTVLTYPNGRLLTYNYGTPGGVNDAISWIGSLIDSDGTDAYSRLFVPRCSDLIRCDYKEPQVKYTLASLSGNDDPATGDVYSGWDRFGRVKDCQWYDYGCSIDVARLNYGYDRADDRLWRANLVAQSVGKNFHELYSYDGLRRLKDMQRGLLTSGNTAISSENFAQCWTLDSTSNWQ